MQQSNSGLLHCRHVLYLLSHKGSPRILEWVAYPFSRGSSCPRNWTGVSCIAGRFFTNWAIREALIILNLRTNMKATKICYFFFLVSLPSFDVCTLKARSPLLLSFLNCMTRTFWSNDILLPPNDLRHTFSLDFYLQDLCEQIRVSIIFINLPRPKKEIY